MTPPIIRVFCPGCGKWTKTNRDSSGVLACTECKAGFRSDDNLMNAQTYIRKLRAERDELRVELDKADGAGTDLLAENERLRAALDLALNALRSYQYGNGSPDLAKEVADKLRTILKGGV